MEVTSERFWVLIMDRVLAYHPQTRQGKARGPSNLEDMLRCLCDDFGKGLPFDLLRDALSAIFGLSESRVVALVTGKSSQGNMLAGSEEFQESSDAQLGVLNVAKILADASKERVKTYTKRRRSTDNSKDSTAGGLFSTAKGVQGKEQITTDEKVAQKLNGLFRNAKGVKGKEQISTDEKVAQKLNDEEITRAIIRPIFEEEYNKIQTLFKKDAEVEKTKTKRILEETLLQESFKKLWAVEALSRRYQVFEDILKGFDKEYLVTLWSLVKERFRSGEPTKDKERELWVELKRLFEPDKDDVLWKLQRYMYDPLT
ncbi:hypothetical protein Tco_1293950 [Tanacetum coccineum]